MCRRRLSTQPMHSCPSMRTLSKKTQWALPNGKARSDLDLREAFHTERLSCRSRLTWTALSAPCHRSIWCLEALRKPRSSCLYCVACQNISLQHQTHEKELSEIKILILNVDTVHIKSDHSRSPRSGPTLDPKKSQSHLPYQSTKAYTEPVVGDEV
jgi:hypothetical protein